jgi:spore germination protein GerM
MVRSTLFLVIAVLLGAAGLYYFQLLPLTRPAAAPQRVMLYVADAQGVFLVPVPQTVDAPVQPEAWAQQVFARLQKEIPPPYVSPLPADAILSHVEYESPHWRLTVSLQTPLGSTSERLLVGSLVETFLAGWSGAQDVRITLLNDNGTPIIGGHQDLSVPLTRRDVGNQLQGARVSGPVRATLWWPALGSQDLIPVQVDLQGMSGVPPQDALALLLAGPGPDSSKFLGRLNWSTHTLKWNRLDDGVAFLDWQNDVAPTAEQYLDLRAVVLSLTEFADIVAVQILSRGVALQVRWGALDLTRPIKRADVQATP